MIKFVLKAFETESYLTFLLVNQMPICDASTAKREKKNSKEQKSMHKLFTTEGLLYSVSM
jgi:hypothetical protein